MNYISIAAVEILFTFKNKYMKYSAIQTKFYDWSRTSYATLSEVICFTQEIGSLL